MAPEIRSSDKLGNADRRFDSLSTMDASLQLPLILFFSSTVLLASSVSIAASGASLFAASNTSLLSRPFPAGSLVLRAPISSRLSFEELATAAPPLFDSTSSFSSDSISRNSDIAVDVNIFLGGVSKPCNNGVVVNQGPVSPLSLLSYDVEKTSSPSYTCLSLVSDATNLPLEGRYDYTSIAGGTASCLSAATLSPKYCFLALERDDILNDNLSRVPKLRSPRISPDFPGYMEGDARDLLPKTKHTSDLFSHEGSELRKFRSQPLSDLTMAAAAPHREENVYMTKFVEQAECYEEMVEFMEKVFAAVDNEDWTVKWRNLLSVAYTNVIGGRRAFWRIKLAGSMMILQLCNTGITPPMKFDMKQDVANHNTRAIQIAIGNLINSNDLDKESFRCVTENTRRYVGLFAEANKRMRVSDSNGGPMPPANVGRCPMNMYLHSLLLQPLSRVHLMGNIQLLFHLILLHTAVDLENATKLAAELMSWLTVATEKFLSPCP